MIKTSNDVLENEIIFKEKKIQETFHWIIGHSQHSDIIKGIELFNFFFRSF